MVLTSVGGQAVLADPELVSLAERISATLERAAVVARVYHLALADGQFTDAERHELLSQLTVLNSEVEMFADALRAVES